MSPTLVQLMPACGPLTPLPSGASELIASELTSRTWTLRGVSVGTSEACASATYVRLLSNASRVNSRMCALRTYEWQIGGESTHLLCGEDTLCIDVPLVSPLGSELSTLTSVECRCAPPFVPIASVVGGAAFAPYLPSQGCRREPSK